MQTPAAFEYERATSVEGAIASLRQHGSGARIIAGGHSLLPMMKLRLANPEHLIDINDLAELSYIREDDGEIRIGALTRHKDLLNSDLLAEHLPVFRDAENVIADPVVRNRGTIGGSLCQADAAEDPSAVCTAVKAKAVIRGADGERVVGMEDFHVGPFMTAVGDGELLTEVRFRSDREAAARTRRSSAVPATGRSRPRRRPSGSTAARSSTDRAQRGRPDDDPPLAGGGAASRQGPVGGAVRAGGPDRLRGLFADRRRPGPVDYKPPRRRPHDTRPAPRHARALHQEV